MSDSTRGLSRVLASLKRVRIDPGNLVVLLLAALAAWPLITRYSLPRLTDAELHVFRVHEIMSAWRAGVPYLRWAPDFFYGYGYPVFHYYAPLTYYLAAAYGFLGGGAVAGVKFVLVISPFLGGLGMYHLLRDRWGALAAMVGAAAFVFSPYFVYIDPQARGAVPQWLTVWDLPVLFLALLALVTAEWWIRRRGGLA